MDSRLLRAIGTPKIQQQASELVERALRALEDLKQLDESLYERFVATRNSPEDAEASANRLRKLWQETFRGLHGLLAYCGTVVGDQKPEAADSSGSFDFGDFGESAPAVTANNELELGSLDIGNLLEGLGDNSEDDTAKWNRVVEKVGSIEYGLRAQLGDARSRLDVALVAGEMNQVLGLLDDTQSSSTEGVQALVAAVYESFLPDVSPTSVLPGYLTSLGRALLVRRGLADLAGKLGPLNDVLQSDRVDEHSVALGNIRTLMRTFVGSVVCRAMRAADRWQMVEFERELSEQPMGVARMTSEGLVKYIESLASINQREVLVLHDQRTLDEMRDALASARQLLDLSPRAAREMVDRAYQAAQRLRGRHPVTDQMILQLDNTEEGIAFLDKLEAVLAASTR